MATIAKLATGALLKVGDGASPEVFTTVPEVKRMRGPAVRFDLIDVSSHDTVGAFREYIPGFADGDAITGEGNWRPSNTVHKNIRIDAYAQTKRNFKLIFADISDNNVLCNTFIQNWEPREDAGSPLLYDFSLKITGAPTWS